MQYIFTYILLVVYTFCISQNNLVLNPSFELYNKDCDTYGTGGIINEYCNNWSSPDFLTPDYFNYCNSDLPITEVGIPNNFFGYEHTSFGYAYSGMALAIIQNQNIQREFIQGETSTVLIKDTLYCISFWLSHADSTNYYINANNIGIYFIDYKSDYTKTPYLTDSLPYIQQKVAFVQEDYYIENDSGWVELKINYKAKGGENHFIIGIFSKEIDTIYIKKTNSITWATNSAYYYLDEVSIYRCNDTLPPPVPKDTAYINLPNAFSPNADGENDVFRVLGGQYVQSIELAVYNRWGQQVFYTNQKEQGWDGTFKGQKAPTGVYAYTLQATLPSGEVIHKKGNVTLKR
jgi:gliding motility-associated-like protein